MDKDLSQLISISNKIGKDCSLVQGGGGNTSVKTSDGKFMYIKASSTAMKDMNFRKGWCKLKLTPILNIPRDKSLAKLDVIKREKFIVKCLQHSCIDQAGKHAKPSIESHIHALLDKYTIHLHPLVVQPYVCSRNGKAVLANLFEDEEVPALWVPYGDPGYMSGKKLSKHVQAYEGTYGRKPGIIFLQKHGLVVTAETSKKVIQLVRKVISKCKSQLEPLQKVEIKHIKRSNIDPVRHTIKRVVAEVTGFRIEVEHFWDAAIAGFLTRKDALLLTQFPALVPHEIANANDSAMLLPCGDYSVVLDILTRRKAKTGKIPAGFLIKDMGLFVVGKKKSISAVKDIIVFSLLSRAWAQKFGGVNPLNKRQRQFVEIVYT